ncbi:MAG: hypothetical protein ACRC1R_10750 [Cetobacterium sp.]|uniref:hypothetical protein n=1 Tax=Cetobacterium sp. TaxID=2071632 RepID=UPI003F39073C
MLKKCFLGIIFISTIIFAQINDNLNILNDGDKTLIQEKIEELKEKNDIKVYVNTLISGEGFEIEDPEKSILINFTQKDDKTVNVEIKFTQDLNMEEKGPELDILLDNLEQFVKEKKYGEYTVEFLNGTQELLSENITLQEQEEYSQDQSRAKYIFFGGIIFICLTILIIILKIKSKRN